MGNKFLWIILSVFYLLFICRFRLDDVYKIMGINCCLILLLIINFCIGFWFIFKSCFYIFMVIGVFLYLYVLTNKEFKLLVLVYFLVILVIFEGVWYL